MMKVSKWQLFFWAALHSADFWQCYIIFPVAFRIRKSQRCKSRVWSFEVHFQPLEAYVPYAVECQHYYAQTGSFPDHDIPF